MKGEDAIPITIEQAATRNEKNWGLMQRSTLPESHGMLFIYQNPQKLTFWMFNCLTDLSLAFLDKNSVITEIHHLKSFPEKMDPKRSVSTLSDIKKYPYNDPILSFFRQNQVTSLYKVLYALEMRSNWFRDNGVKVGDQLLWERNATNAYIIPKEGIRRQKE